MRILLPLKLVSGEVDVGVGDFLKRAIALEGLEGQNNRAAIVAPVARYATL